MMSRKVKLTSAFVLFLTGWCCSAMFSAAATTAQSPAELIQAIRESQPNGDCETEQNAVDYWVAVVEAAENSLTNAWEDLEDCEDGGEE